ncbi:cytochrome P450 monooxygenase pc-3 [Cantharellus anzutake]|uniref:cytochrome P450 monooxygenase pc-3 n=1 Tax=Cantharellus anzutake TaxID=1750568 RepID=UPI001905CF04|nr:cytochrome P450 monooxygenase pc-3 [Cantharellus anzutake]KAF8342228.1 cytochrome P450 monooxygenase pc-3 [Cantharellus anzutake]
MRRAPGLELLARLIPKLCLVPILLYLALKLWAPSRGSVLDNGWIKTALLVVFGPLSMYLRRKWYFSVNTYRAYRLSVKEIPLVEGKWPGSIDLLYKLMKAFETEYVGDAFEELVMNGWDTIRVRVLWEENILTFEPQYVKQILATNFPNYEKGNEEFGEATGSVLGSGVFNADGDLWKFHRTLARPFFSRERIIDHSFSIFERHSTTTFVKMKERFDAGAPIDFQDVMARFTLDSATEFLFGRSVESTSDVFLEPGGIVPVSIPTSTPEKVGVLHGPSAYKFVKAFVQSQIIISLRIRMGKIWKLTEFWGDKSLPHMRDIHEFLDPILEDALERVGNKGGEGIDEDTNFLMHMITQTKDRKIIRDSIMNMLIAGRDTTACLLTFVIYMLSQHPHVLEKLKEEINRTIGHQKIPTFDDIRLMKYLRAVLNETLRLFPPVPFDLRYAIEEDILTSPDGTRYYVPPNTTVSYGIVTMHRAKSLWGDDALEFDPERWLDDRLRRVTENPFIFLPFNAGPRICLGQQFAYNEASFMIIRLLQTFSTIQLTPEAQPNGSLPRYDHWAQRPAILNRRHIKEKIWPRSHVTLYAEGGLWLKMGSYEEGSGDE